MDRKDLDRPAGMALFQRRRRNSGMTAEGTRSDKGLLNAAALFRRDRGRRAMLAEWRAAMFGPGDRRSRPPSDSDDV
jgi:hypothetical protein